MAGVSIGSLYQYFPDKRAIFDALHQRHIDQIDRVIESTLVKHAASALDELMRALVEAMVDAHTADTEFYKELRAHVPHKAGARNEFAVRLHRSFLLAIAARRHELKKTRDPVKAAFIVAHMVESLSHGVILRRPPALSREEATEEAIRAIVAYLRS